MCRAVGVLFAVRFMSCVVRCVLCVVFCVSCVVSRVFRVLCVTCAVRCVSRVGRCATGAPPGERLRLRGVRHPLRQAPPGKSSALDETVSRRGDGAGLGG